MTAPVDSLSVRELVRQLGGPAQVGREIGVTTEAVCAWSARNSVPHGRRLTLWRMAAAASIDWRPPGCEGLTLAPAEPDQAANGDDADPQRVA